MKRKCYVFFITGLLMLSACGKENTILTSPDRNAASDSITVTAASDSGNESETSDSVTDEFSGIEINGILRIPDYHTFSYEWCPDMSAGELDRQLALLSELYPEDGEITDEWISRHFSEYNSVDAYLLALKTRYSEEETEKSRSLAEEYVLRRLYEETEVLGDFDERTAERSEAILSGYSAEAEALDMTLAEYAESTFGIGEEELRKAVLQISRRQIVLYEAVLGIAGLEGISVTDEEYSELFSGIRLEDPAYSGLSDTDYELLVGKETLRKRMLYEKTISFLTELAMENGRITAAPENETATGEENTETDGGFAAVTEDTAAESDSDPENDTVTNGQ